MEEIDFATFVYSVIMSDASMLCVEFNYFILNFTLESFYSQAYLEENCNKVDLKI